MAEDAAFRI